MVVCSAVSSHAKVLGGIILCHVLCGSLGQKVKHTYLMAVIWQLPLWIHGSVFKYNLADASVLKAELELYNLHNNIIFSGLRLS